MGTRRDAREWAVQMLFTVDLNPDSRKTLFDEFWSEHPHDDKTRSFAEGLVSGVLQNLQHIDKLITGYASNWGIGRMAVTDRNVLRLAMYEMLYREDIPPVVSINEAVDLAKYFNSAESGRFVNGVLDRARRNLKVAEKNGE